MVSIIDVYQARRNIQQRNSNIATQMQQTIMDRHNNNNNKKNKSNNFEKSKNISISATSTPTTATAIKSKENLQNYIRINNNKDKILNVDISADDELNYENLDTSNRFVTVKKPIYSNNNNVVVENVASKKSKIKLRFLIFIEDSDGSRSNIFDSEKYLTEKSNLINEDDSTTTSTTAGNKLSSSANANTNIHSKLTQNRLINNNNKIDSSSFSHMLSRSIQNNFKLSDNNHSKENTTKQEPKKSMSNHSNLSSNSNAQTSTKLNNEMIKRMIFGSFPMNVSSNTAIKVHSLKNSNKTMISNVFTFYNTQIVNKEQSDTPNCYCGPNSDNSKNTTIQNGPTSISPSTTTDSDTNSQTIKTLKSDNQSSISNNDNNNKTKLVNKSNTIPINKSNYLQEKTQTNNNNNNNSKTKFSSTKTNSVEISSSSSSLNSSSNLSHLNLNVCCPSSSVPACYGSHAVGLYKRFMRSVSNSLISSSSVLLNTNDTTGELNCSVTPLAHQIDKINEQKNEQQQQQQQTNKDQDVERISLSGVSNSGSQKPQLCEKCMENNCYPKYKIGVSIIFCLPQQQQQRNSATSTPPSSPTNNQSPNSSTIKTTPYFIGSNYSINEQKNNAQKNVHVQNLNDFSKQQQLDMLEIFPSTNLNSMPNSPSSQSPIHATSPQSSSHLFNRFNLDQSANDEFYDFFFSHLPIIEYQFKELREKITHHLPEYFLNNSKFNLKNRHRHSIVSQRSNNESFNGTNYNNNTSNNLNKSYSSLNSLNSLPNQLLASNFQLTFLKKMIKEFEEYEKKFNLLYNSPRLASPAWLTLINSKKNLSNLISESNSASQFQKTNTKTNINNICKNLINDFSYLNNIKYQNVIDENNISFTSTDFNLININKYKKSDLSKSTLFQNIKNTFSNHSLNNYNNMFINSEKNKLFLSNLLSTILKYHLSWVYTVLPSNDTISKDHLASDESLSSSDEPKLRKQWANWTKLLEKTNPYNPLWAQLGDIHGAVNQPLKLVRTVVIGHNRELIEKTLFLLSYFIRCGNSSYFDISQENFDFEALVKKDEIIQEENDNTEKLGNKEININEKFDPIAQLTSLISSSSFEATSSLDQFNSNNNKSLAKPFSVLSSNSSIASVSPNFSSSSSPFNAISPQISNSNMLNKERHLSSNSNGKNCSALELPLIGCQLKPNYLKSTRIQDNFGYSLLASFCEEFVFEFVLHGTSDTSFLNDLQQRLIFSKNNSILDCPVDESIYIVVNIDELEIKVYSSEHSKPLSIEKPIGLVDSLVNSVFNMIKLFNNSEFVLLHLEDKLQEFYGKALTLQKIKSQSKSIDNEKLIKLMEISDSNDLEFLNSILSAITLPNFL